jgi:hypothetical protein
MALPKHEHSALIDAIGASIVRRQFGLTHQTLYAWRVRGVPAHLRAPFAQLAMIHGKDVPRGFVPTLEDIAA